MTGVVISAAGAVGVKRLLGLESENAKLKRIASERGLEIETPEEISGQKW